MLGPLVITLKLNGYLLSVRETHRHHTATETITIDIAEVSITNDGSINSETLLTVAPYLKSKQLTALSIDMIKAGNFNLSSITILEPYMKARDVRKL